MANLNLIREALRDPIIAAYPDFVAAVAAACDKTERLERLFDQQWKRSREAGELWRQAHPGNDNASPDLGELLTWLMGRINVPQGWQLVPSEPKPEMLGAWYRYKNGHHFSDEPPPRDTSDYGAYRAMLAAAPTVSSGTSAIRQRGESE